MEETSSLVQNREDEKSELSMCLLVAENEIQKIDFWEEEVDICMYKVYVEIEGQERKSDFYKSPKLPEGSFHHCDAYSGEDRKWLIWMMGFNTQRTIQAQRDLNLRSRIDCARFGIFLRFGKIVDTFIDLTTWTENVDPQNLNLGDVICFYSAENSKQIVHVATFVGVGTKMQKIFLHKMGTTFVVLETINLFCLTLIEPGESPNAFS